MIDENSQKRELFLFSFLCCLVYFTSYMTRINYGAVISEIITATGIAKGEAGLVTTFSFISYGAGQLVSGILGDRFNPKKLIFIGLLSTGACNLVIPFCQNAGWMSGIWCVNGFAQSMMWPPLVKIMTTYLSGAQYKKTCVNVTLASSVATIIIYLAAPVCIVIYGWQLVFWLGTLLAVATSILWMAGLRHIERRIPAQAADSSAEVSQFASKAGRLSFKLFASSGAFIIGIGIIMQGTLRDGITTWMPSFVAETFHLENASAILTTVALPLFSVFCLKLTQFLHQKYLKDELFCAAVIFLVGFAGCLLLSAFSSENMGISTLLAAVITGCMHGVNLMLIGMVPQKFERYGAVATASGLLNSLTYVGSALSSYGFARLSEQFGWSFTLATWSVIAFIGTAACFLCLRRWKRFKELPTEA